MKVKLDKSIECLINEKYKIDIEVLQELEQRRQLANDSVSTIKQILSEAPTPIEEPEETDSAVQNLINKARYQYKLKERELETTIGLLSILDTSIDKIDEVVKNIDSKANTLIDEINNQIDVVKNAYDYRIQSGCRNNLTWQFIGTSIGYNQYTNVREVYSNYKAVKDIDEKIEVPYYGIKYYQKPLNIDYGYNIISEVQGTIQIGSTSLAITGSGNTSLISIDDNITDDLNTSSLLYVGEMPKVIGFGTTTSIGINTTIIGSISLGSSIFAVTGIGTTTDVSFNHYTVNSAVFLQDTKVVGFGTTAIQVNYATNSGISTTNLFVPSIILNKVAISSITDEPVGFGSSSQFPSLILDKASLSTIDNRLFTVIRQTKDITQEVDFTKNPLDPVKIGIINSSRLGVGHTVKLINNGFSSKPQYWREVLTLESEPSVGNDSVSYYDGNKKWPYISTYPITYAVENRIYKFDSSIVGIPTTTNDSPTGIDPNGDICAGYATSISIEVDKLEKIEQKNINKIKNLIEISMSIRSIRDEYELKAWSYSQSCAYIRMELNKLKKHLKEIENINLENL